MSLKNRLDELIDELLDEANATGEGEAYNTKYSFGKLDDEDIEVMGYKKVKNVKESTFKKAAKLMIGEGSYRKSTKRNLYSISERMQRISEKLRKF